MNPLVSIVVTCYNRADRLPETMDAVFAQRYEPVEIVVIDDGSTDGTRELMAGYGDRVRYHPQPNQGIAVARTAGGRQARGELIAYQDDDDLMPPDRIVRLHEALCRYPAAVMAVGDWSVIDGAGNEIGLRSRCDIRAEGEQPVLVEDAYSAVLWSRITPVPHTTLFKRETGDRVGWFDTRFFHACEDTDFFARCARLGPLVYVPHVVSLYRREQGSLSATGVLLHYSRFLLLEKHLRELGREDDALRARLRVRLHQTLRQLAADDIRGVEFPPSVSREKLAAATALLGTRRRLKFAWQRGVEFPARRIARALLNQKKGGG